MTSVWLIGEAPGKGGRPGESALLGRIGRRIARLMGIGEDDYRWQTVRKNLLPDWPGKAPGNGSAWPVKRAKRAARKLEEGGLFAIRPNGRLVILLGRRVAAAFGFQRQKWFEPFSVAPMQGMHAVVFVAPHPSGASRWWNSPRNVEKAARFWRGIRKRMMA